MFLNLIGIIWLCVQTQAQNECVISNTGPSFDDWDEEPVILPVSQNSKKPYVGYAELNKIQKSENWDFDYFSIKSSGQVDDPHLIVHHHEYRHKNSHNLKEGGSHKYFLISQPINISKMLLKNSSNNFIIVMPTDSGIAVEYKSDITKFGYCQDGE